VLEFLAAPDIDPEHIKGYAEVARLGKPFGFTEYGPYAS
jgi:beta-mannanase